MSDRELALGILNIYYSDKNDFTLENHLIHFFKILERIRKHKSETISGKLEEILYEYDREVYTSDFAKDRLIDNIRNIIKGE